MSSIRLVCLRMGRMCFLGRLEVPTCGSVIVFLCQDRELDGWELVVLFSSGFDSGFGVACLAVSLPPAISYCPRL